MIIEVCVTVSTIAFVVLVIFLIVILSNSCATLKKTKHTLTKIEGELKEISSESIILLKNVNDLTVDMKEKAKSLNFLFLPLLKLSQGKPHKVKNAYEKLTEVINYIADAVILLKKIKDE